MNEESVSNASVPKNPQHEQKEPQMTTQEQQVTVQELQRLNDAIAMTMDAIRRVVPQIAVLHAQAQQGLPFGQLGYGGYGVGVGVGLGGYSNPWQQQQLDPISAAYVQGHTQALRHLISQTQIGYGMGGFGYGYQPQPTTWHNPYHFQGVGVSPFVNLTQRPI
jgi:hypothetical protein